MDDRAIRLHEFIAEYPFSGNWEICYTDGTHLKNGEYIKAGRH